MSADPHISPMGRAISPAALAALRRVLESEGLLEEEDTMALEAMLFYAGIAPTERPAMVAALRHFTMARVTAVLNARATWVAAGMSPVEATQRALRYAQRLTR